MPLPSNVHELMANLHEQGVVNLDTSIRSLVQPAVLGSASPNSLPTDIIIGPRYVFVTKVGQQAGINEQVGAVAGHTAGIR